MNNQPNSKRDIYLTEIEPEVLKILKLCAEAGIPAYFSCNAQTSTEVGVRSKFNLDTRMFGGDFPY